MNDRSAGSGSVAGKGMDRIRAAMEEGIRRNVFPGGVVVVAEPGGTIFCGAFGCGRRFPAPVPMTPDSVFDLASLTKPLATALAVALLVEAGTWDWDTRIADVLGWPRGVGAARREIRLGHLLEHSSGLPSFRPYYLCFRGREGPECRGALRRMLAVEPLLAPPGRTVRYSDVGYMLLEWAVETAAGTELPSLLEERVYRPLGGDMGFFPVDATSGDRPWVQTAYCAYRKRYVQGEVHDRNAFAVGGYSGHAGLFGTAEGVACLMSRLYRCYCGEGPGPGGLTRRRVEELFTPWTPGSDSTFRRGFDTPSPVGSAAGAWFPARSVGHLGFTGTSFWMDLESGFVVVLLTNRLLVRPRNSRIRRFRAYFHEVVWTSVYGKDGLGG